MVPALLMIALAASASIPRETLPWLHRESSHRTSCDDLKAHAPKPEAIRLIRNPLNAADALLAVEEIEVLVLPGA